MMFLFFWDNSQIFFYIYITYFAIKKNTQAIVVVLKPTQIYFVAQGSKMSGTIDKKKKNGGHMPWALTRPLGLQYQ